MCMKNLTCPYCKKKNSYYMGFLERKKGEHTCTKCGKNSTIFYNIFMKIAVTVTIILSLAIFVIWYKDYNHEYINGAIVLLTQSIIFLFISPLFIHFVPLKSYNNEFNYNNDDEEIENNNFENNVIIDYENESIKANDFINQTQNEKLISNTKVINKINEVVKDEDGNEFIDISSF